MPLLSSRFFAAALLGCAAAPMLRAQEPVQPASPRQLLRVLAQPLDETEAEKLHRAVTRAFGHEALVKNRAAAKVEGTTVAWAVLAEAKATLRREDGKVLGEMIPLGADGLQVLALDLPNFSETHYRIEVDGRTRLGGQVRIEHFELGADSQPLPDVPKGRLESFEWKQSQVFPNTVRQVTVYTPAGYKSGMNCALMIWQDGTRHSDPNGPLRTPVVFDNLIHRGDIPPLIGIFIDPGRRPNQKPGEKAANRGFEYDSLGEAYARFLLEEILPEVRRRYQVEWSSDPDACALAGGSSGGICAFTAAWERPDHFRKVLSWVGSFVDLRGGHVYPSLIRTSERKPLRVYLLGGKNDLDNPYGHWPIANKLMAAALAYQGYDHHLEWTPCFHGTRGMAPHLPDALRWLWRDWQSTLKVANK